MFKLLGFLLIFLLAILLIGLGLIGLFFRNLLNLARRHTSAASGSAESGSDSGRTKGCSFQGGDSSTGKCQTTGEGTRPRHKKLFGQDEGEYVDFEEIKD